MEFSSINKTNQKEQDKAICYIMEPIKIIDRMAYLYIPNDLVNFILITFKRIQRMTDITRKNRLYFLCVCCGKSDLEVKYLLICFMDFCCTGPLFCS